MKLRNKRTGEIGYLVVGKGCDYYLVTNDDWNACGKYNSLTELNEEWEDYKEGKHYYAITSIKADNGITKMKNKHNDMTSFDKSIGNYFESKEDAEKAVEKLKAWKRLKANGFEFTEWGVGFDKTLVIKAKYTRGQIYDDMNLLFGGEE